MDLWTDWPEDGRVDVRDNDYAIYVGEALERLRWMPGGSVDCCVTSPPYWGLRDYQNGDQIGLERTPEGYVDALVAVFREVRRTLVAAGTLWVVIGDSYAVGGRGGGSYETERPSWETIKGKRIERGSGRYRGGNNQAPGCKAKDLVGIPWMLAFALRRDGWYLRSDIIWAKPNAMPESCKDRPTRSHEYVFLLSKSKTYYYDWEAIQEDSVAGHSSGNGFKREARLSYRDKDGARGNDEEWVPGNCKDSFKRSGNKRGVEHLGHQATHREERPDVAYDGPKRNARDVWTVNTKPYRGAHFAVYPEKLIEPCVLAGCPPGGLVLDPFIGSGTTALVALKHGRRCVGVELNANYIEIAWDRCHSGK